jgi:hypothetical protein
MYLPIPTALVFLFLVIASFAPIASTWPGWWLPYYLALLSCWIVTSVAALRRIGRRERKAKRTRARRIRELADARSAAESPKPDTLVEHDEDRGETLHRAPSDVVGRSTSQ